MAIPWEQRTPEYRAAHNANRKNRGKYGKHYPKPRTFQFIAVDGEGVTRADGSHDYTLLAASDRSSVDAWGAGGLSTEACFDYLLDLKVRHPHATFVAFAFGYDVNMMLRDISRSELDHLNEGQGYTRLHGGWIAKFVPGKSFYIGRGHRDKTGRWKSDAGVTIWDTWGFFQSSFVRALKEWRVCEPETIDIIERMKDKRGEFTNDMQGLITGYCFRECELLVKLMREFKTVSDAAEIHLKRWDGAGAAAAELLRSRGAKQHIGQEYPAAVETACLHAYFGGRIESYGAGIIEGPTYEYDINSAYPAELSQLPSMERGDWAGTDKPAYIAYDGLYRVRWELPANVPIGPFPWRDSHGAILYPLRGEGWYHGAEVIEAMIAHVDYIDVLEEWRWYHDNVYPFDWIEPLYEQRRKFKEMSDARHIVIKLALNAAYGKLAQSVGWSMQKRPAFQSYYMAGRITSGTRAKMYAAARRAGDSAILCMTDGLFTRDKLALPLGKHLGAWDVSTLEAGLCVVQPGVVVSPSAGNPTNNGSFSRSRGFLRASLDYEAVTRAWLDRGLFAEFPVIENRFIGMGRALAAETLSDWTLEPEYERDILGNLISEQWRRWVTVQKTITFRANLKRKDIGAISDKWIEWIAPEGRDEMSAIYNPKNIFRALDILQRNDTASQPNGNEGAAIFGA